MVLLLLLILLGTSYAQDELIVFLLDTSGSMQGQEQSMVEGVNKLIGRLEQVFRSTGSQSAFNVQMYTFSWKRNLLLEAPLSSVPLITTEQYRADGGTALFDTIGETLSTIRDNSTIVIATDGEDTSSTKYSKAEISEMIEKAKETRDIHFIFLAKGPEAFVGGEAIGLNKGTGAYAVPIASNVQFASIMTSGSVVGTVSASMLRHVDPKE